MTTILARRVLPKEAAAVRREATTLAKAVRSGATFGLGETGPAVKALQSHLRAAGLLKGPVTGTFDAATEAALKAFQEAKNLQVTGQADRASVLQLRRLNVFVKDEFVKSPASEGQRGKDILSAERHLAKLGFLDKSKVDGVFDGATTKAVKWYRKDDKQVPNGSKRIGNLFYKELRRASAAQSRAESGSLLVATVNDDFTDGKTNLKGINADVMLVQEAKNTNVHKKMEKEGFGVHQNLESDSKAGSAVAWNKDVVKAGDRGYALGVKPNGAGMLTRWISWTDVKVGDKSVRMISVHRPPKRYSFLWKRFDKNLAEFVKSTKGPVVVGMDANQVNPQGLARTTGLKWQAPKGSIDGFLVSPGVTVEKMWRLPKATSDHHPVVAKISLKSAKK